MQSSRRIDEQRVASGLDRFLAAAAGKLDRTRSLFGSAFVNRQLQITSNHRQLLSRSRPVYVHRNHHGRMPVLRQETRKLTRAGCLSGALQSDDHDDCGRLIRKPEFRLMRSENMNQLVVNDLDDLLAG